MKTDALILAGLAGLALYFLMMKKPATSPSGSGAALIENKALPGQPGWGWQYFTDGTAISPEGVYYSQGVEVWRPA